MDGTMLRYSFDENKNLLLDDVIALSSLQYTEMRNILYEGMREDAESLPFLLLTIIGASLAIRS